MDRTNLGLHDGEAFIKQLEEALAEGNVEFIKKNKELLKEKLFVLNKKSIRDR